MVKIYHYHPANTPAMASMIETALDAVRAVGRGEREAHMRLYRPAPTLAFGRRDQLNPQFSWAVQAAQKHGFEPLVRRVGGHAAAYHRGCLVLDHFQYDSDAVSGNQQRYRQFGQLLAQALETLGVHAGVGQVAGEYCPGEYSIWGQLANGKRVKLIGTAQRVVAGAWWFSAGIVVEDSAPLRAVTCDVYQALGLPLEPATVGAVQDIEPLATVDDLEDAILEVYQGAGYSCVCARP